MRCLDNLRKQMPIWLLPVRNTFYFLIAFYIFSYSTSWLLVWRHDTYKIWYLFRANDPFENLFLLVTAVCFCLDTIPVFLVPELPGRRDIYIHHAMIVVMAVWCIVKGQGFPFVMFAGLQEASNLSYLAKVYFKNTATMRFIAQCIHVAIFLFFRFIVQAAFLLVSLVYLQVPICYEALCIGIDSAFFVVLLLSIRWCYLDLKKLRQLYKQMKKGDYQIINSEETATTPDQEKKKQPPNPYVAVIAFLLIVILLMMATAIVLILHFLSKPLYPSNT